MSAVNCRYCGLPFRVTRVEPGRDYFCCTGCAVLSRVPRDVQGNFPVNSHLVSTLAVGFVYFNQLLASAVSFLLRREGRVDLADRFTAISFVAAILVWAGVLLVQRREGVFRAKDFVFGSLCLALLAAGGLGATPNGCLTAATNAIWLLWNFRGLLRGKANHVK